MGFKRKFDSCTINRTIRSQIYEDFTKLILETTEETIPNKNLKSIIRTP